MNDCNHLLLPNLQNIFVFISHNQSMVTGKKVGRQLSEVFHARFSTKGTFLVSILPHSHRTNHEFLYCSVVSKIFNSCDRKAKIEFFSWDLRWKSWDMHTNVMLWLVSWIEVLE